ncbi:ABC transporter permease [Pseudomonas pudica]|uniref:ABC transporter permease n=1 Tax=Pseudomonas pudica TaxID=272772 RepID=A0ABS0FUQ1_9PSED|nr:ABC transporter permease [Pseudomonas pudica]MBF8644027.1 ABC transporter permease [Pseudomonas pudica]MBF8758606.1 ABC transporter permease [Pseudomonas pudica]
MTFLLPSSRLRFIGGNAGLFRFALLTLVILVFAVTLDSFGSSRNAYALLQAFALLGLVSLGLAATMLVGEFDLSVGSMVAVSGLITLKVGGSDHLLGGVLAAVAFAAAVGLFNALVFAWLRLSSLVITVGTMIALSGFAYWLAGGKVINTENFDAGSLLDDSILGFFSVRSLLTLGMFLLMYLLLKYTRLGRNIFATGSKALAAKASGVSTTRVYIFVFVFSSVCAALAGSLLSISLATASATMGSNLLLQAASAAIVGGIALSGGVGGVGGVLVGVLILTALNNGLSLWGASAAAIAFANGMVLLLVVMFDGRLGHWFRTRTAQA